VTTDEPYDAESRATRHKRATTSSDATTLDVLARDPIWRVRRAVARNPLTCAATLTVLACDPHDEVRASVLAHPSCPSEAVAIMVNDPRRGLRSVAMARSDTSMEQIAQRANSDPAAAAALAARACDPRSHPLLCASPVTAVREAVARSGVAEPETLRLLAESGDPRVDAALCTANNLPQDVLIRLAASRWPAVQCAVASRHDLPLRTWLRLFRADDDEVVERLVQNPTLPFVVVAWVVLRVRIQTRWVTTALASSEAMPRLFAWYFTTCPHWEIRHAIARRRKVSRLTMWHFARDKQWSVRAALARRTDLPPRVQRKILKKGGPPKLALAANPTISSRTANALVKDHDEFVAGRALANPVVATATLVEHARGLDREPWILRNIAENRNCPVELRDEILTWLALGGAGNKDPLFDPITCVSHPGDRLTARYVVYRDLARAEGSHDSSLWAVRAAATLDCAEISRIEQYACDDRVEVRRVAIQRTLPYRRWRGMAWDCDPYLRRSALSVWTSTHFPRRKELFNMKQWERWERARGRRTILGAVTLAAIFPVAAATFAASSGIALTFLPIYAIVFFGTGRYRE
jgi:hypothetical protein